MQTVAESHARNVPATGARAAGRLSWRRSPWTVAGLVLLVYALWIAVLLLSGHDARDFIVIGRAAITRSHTSTLIQYDPHYVYRDRLGYDGQYCYFLALDPIRARFYMDFPAYRYTRILYPLLARVVALGQAALVPYALIALNWLAVAGGTLAVAAWLRRKRLSPWLALIYGFSLGMFLAVNGDLTEPLAYALVALAVYLFDCGERRRVLWAGVAFALAMLTRETTAVFALLYGLALLLSGATLATWRTTIRANWRRAALLLSMAFAPFALYKLFLLLWLGSLGTPDSVRLELIPFHGLLVYWPLSGFRIVEVEGVVLPALLCAAIGLWALRTGLRDVAVWALLANVLLFIVMLPASSYIDQFASARIATGVLLAALYCLPRFDALLHGKRLWLVAASLLWLLFLPIQALGMLIAH